MERATQIIRVGDVEVNLRTRELRRAGERIALQRRVFDLLVHLIEHRDRVVTKTEILATFWPDERVVDDVVTSAIHALRRAFDDDARRPSYLRTVHRIGYQLVAQVKTESLAGQSPMPMPMPMPSPVAEARHATFVGRPRETALFADMIAGRSAVQLLMVNGPPGIGKTTLLQELSYQCRTAGLDHVWMSGESAGPVVDAFLRALACALGCESSLGGIRERLAARPCTIFVDDIHLLSALAEWLREELWPALPPDARLVLAGRGTVSARWRCDPAFARTACVADLDPFTASDAQKLFAARGRLTWDEDIWRITRGHPLALALAADALSHEESDLPWLDRPQVLDALVHRFTDQITDVGRLRAFEAACLLDDVLERSLSALDDPASAADRMHWLSSLSFVEARPDALRVHALVREVVIARLGQRSPHRLADLVGKVHRFWLSELASTADLTEKLRLSNLLLGMGRHHPKLRASYAVSDEGPDCTVQPATAEERALLPDFARTHEGEECADIARRWLATPSASVWSVRDSEGTTAGLLMTLRLRIGDRAAVAAASDPVVDAIFRFLDSAADTGPDDEVLVHRTMIARDDYQALSTVTRQCHAVMQYAHLWHAHHSPSVAHVFVVYGVPDVWDSLAAAGRYVRLVDREVDLGGRRHAAFHLAIRAIPFETWLEQRAAVLIDAIRAAAPPAPG